MSAIGQCLVAFIFGSVVGLLVQRSRFCNTAALRDAILFKTYRNTKALLVAMMIPPGPPTPRGTRNRPVHLRKYTTPGPVASRGHRYH